MRKIRDLLVSFLKWTKFSIEISVLSGRMFEGIGFAVRSSSRVSIERAFLLTTKSSSEIFFLASVCIKKFDLFPLDVYLTFI